MMTQIRTEQSLANEAAALAGTSTTPRLAASDTPACYLSIDLEDYAHDYQRALGIRRPRHDPQSLWRAFEALERFSLSHLSGARITFFTTGQVARDHPDLVGRIAAGGHEIACHHYEHDQITSQDRKSLRADLERAVDVLETAANQTILGFRAPDFAIDRHCAQWVYEELARLFLYDSSSLVERPRGGPPEPSSFNVGEHRLYEVPVYSRPVLPGLSLRVMGGTYLRLLPTRVILFLLTEARARGFVPLVYMHPYDLLSDYEQWSRFSELADLPLARRTYWWARQHQWHSIGNRTALAKLERIFTTFRHPGPMASMFVQSNGSDQTARQRSGWPDVPDGDTENADCEEVVCGAHAAPVGSARRGQPGSSGVPSVRTPHH